LILCLAAGACSTTTAATKASFTLSVPEPIPDSALVRADIRADDLSAVLDSAEGLVFVPPESCLSGAQCDALIESFEVAAAKLGAKVIHWREAVGQDAQTLTFLGAELLVEVEELQVSESRFSEEGGLAVALSSVRKSRQMPRSRPTLSFRRDEAGRLVRMTPSELSRQVTEVTRVTDPRVIARINNMCR